MDKRILLDLGYNIKILDKILIAWENIIGDNYELIKDYELYYINKYGEISHLYGKNYIILEDNLFDMVSIESKKYLSKNLMLYKNKYNFIRQSEKKESDELYKQVKAEFLEEHHVEIIIPNEEIDENYDTRDFEDFMIDKIDKKEEQGINVYNLDISKYSHIGKKLQNAYLYQILIDGKLCYIGKTSRDIKERISEHIKCVFGDNINNSQQNYLYKAMRECNVGYKFEIIYESHNEISNFVLENMEKDLIEEFKPVYNYQGVKVQYKFSKSSCKEVEDRIQEVRKMVNSGEITSEEAWNVLCGN